MTGRDRARLYRHLTHKLGNPAHYDDAKRERVKRMLDGWLGERMPDRRVGFMVAHNLLPPRTYNKPTGDKLATDGWLDSCMRDAMSAAHITIHTGRWNLRTRCRLPDGCSYKHAIPTLPGWSILQWEAKRKLKIAISPSYHLTVAKHEVAQDGRRIVQCIWNHRDYGDIQVWQCRFWDFDCLTNDENSFLQAKHYEGYVAKISTHIAVDESFEKALNKVRRRTVSGVVRAIVSDGEE